MRAADTGFQHAPAPHRHVVSLADVVNLFRFSKSAYAADFDIYNPASPGFDGSGAIASVTDGFIQADGGTQLALKAGVVVDVIVPERLFNHEQIELVKLAEMVKIVECVR